MWKEVRMENTEILVLGNDLTIPHYWVVSLEILNRMKKTPHRTSNSIVPEADKSALDTIIILKQSSSVPRVC